MRLWRNTYVQAAICNTMFVVVQKLFELELL